MLIQPYIENALKHGLLHRKTDRELTISFSILDENIKCVIEDNGVGRKRSKEISDKKIHKRDSIGVKLTEDRLENFAQSFKNDFSITFIDLYDNDRKPKGTKVILKIPLK